MLSSSLSSCGARCRGAAETPAVRRQRRTRSVGVCVVAPQRRRENAVAAESAPNDRGAPQRERATSVGICVSVPMTSSSAGTACPQATRPPPPTRRVFLLSAFRFGPFIRYGNRSESFQPKERESPNQLLSGVLSSTAPQSFLFMKNIQRERRERESGLELLALPSISRSIAF